MWRNKNLFPLIRNLVIAEVVFYGAFLILALSADWNEIYENYFGFLSNYVPFTILEFTGLAAAQIALIIYVFSRSGGQDNIYDIISSGENEHLEFKTSLRWDVRRGQVKKELEKSVLKTIAAFLNSEGGNLVIGVDDTGSISGLDPDFKSLAKQNLDGFENHFNNIFKTSIGPEFRRLVKLQFYNIRGTAVCLISVQHSHKPVYVRDGETEGFFIRTGNATTQLKVSEVTAYVASWWQK